MEDEVPVASARVELECMLVNCLVMENGFRLAPTLHLVVAEGHIEDTPHALAAVVVMGGEYEVDRYAEEHFAAAEAAKVARILQRVMRSPCSPISGSKK